MKRGKQLLALLAGLLCLMLCSLTVFADTFGQSAGIDAVLVIDCSGSLDMASGGTDPDKISLEAAKLFIDMTELSGSRVGIVAFSNVIEGELGLTQINSDADKDRIKASIDALPADYKGDTDIGMGLEHAMQYLASANDVGNNKTILLFTDGDIDLPKDANGNTDPAGEAAREATSEQQVRTAASDASNAGIKIYTVGLNANGGLDDTLIREVADATGGKEYPATKADDLPAIFFDIFAELINSKTDDTIEPIQIEDPNLYYERTFNIPNSSVMEANIVMTSNAPLSDVQLVKPDGTEVVADGQHAVLNKYSRITSLKLISPIDEGDWTLKVKSAEKCTVGVNLVMNYDVVYVASVSDGSANNKALVKAHFEQEGTPLTEAALYSQFTSVVRVNKGGNVTEVPMTFDGADFSGEVDVAPGETITLTAFAESPSMYRESAPVSYTNGRTVTINTTPLPSPVVLEGLVPSMAKTTMDLSGYFVSSDPSSPAAISQLQVTDPSIADSNLNGMTLSLSGKKNGATDVTVTASDPTGQVTTSQTMQVVVKAKFPSLIPLIAIGAGILALLIGIIVAIILLANRPKLSGVLVWKVKSSNMFGNKAANKPDLEMECGGRESDLSVVITDSKAAGYDLDKIAIKALKNGIRLINKSSECTLFDGYGEEQKTLDVSADETFEVHCGEDDVIIQCEYTRPDELGDDGDGLD